MKLQDALIIKMNQAGVTQATFFPQAESWTLLTHPGNKRVEMEVPNDQLDATLARLAAGDKIDGDHTTGAHVRG